MDPVGPNWPWPIVGAALGEAGALAAGCAGEGDPAAAEEVAPLPPHPATAKTVSMPTSPRLEARRSPEA
ncbi:MAG: hypothetical protein ABSD62_03535 [Candidatus Limnocylindrales bacterium]|jgi:hypothetical protein